MTEKSPPAPDLPILHALLICRGLESSETGELTIHNVVEVLPVETVPTEVGPLTFVAMVRNLPAGPSKGSFLLGAGDPEGQRGRLPFDADIPPMAADRQMVMQITIPKLPITAPGWFHVAFEWDGAILGENKFLIGLMASSDTPEESGSP